MFSVLISTVPDHITCTTPTEEVLHSFNQRITSKDMSRASEQVPSGSHSRDEDPKQSWPSFISDMDVNPVEIDHVSIKGLPDGSWPDSSAKEVIYDFQLTHGPTTLPHTNVDTATENSKRRRSLDFHSRSLLADDELPPHKNGRTTVPVHDNIERPCSPTHRRQVASSAPKDQHSRLMEKPRTGKWVSPSR